MKRLNVYDFKVILASGEIRTVRVSSKDLKKFIYNQEAQAISEKILQPSDTFTFELIS